MTRPKCRGRAWPRPGASPRRTSQNETASTWTHCVRAPGRTQLTTHGLGISFNQSIWSTPVAFGQVRRHAMSLQ